jgi:predicted amidohydrolase YtcJ
VTTSNPFYTLSFAVTGKMIGGRKVNRQSITREQALIAHTRNNAFIVFQEANLGSLQSGKYADLLVLDRDYLKVPADQIKDIKPVMTMVGGKISTRQAVKPDGERRQDARSTKCRRRNCRAAWPGIVRGAGGRPRFAFVLAAPVLAAEQADVILHHGKIVTVDDYFTVAQRLVISVSA